MTLTPPAEEPSELSWIEIQIVGLDPKQLGVEVVGLSVFVKDSDNKKESERKAVALQGVQHTWIMKEKEACAAFSKDIIRVIAFEPGRSNKKIDEFKIDADTVFASRPATDTDNLHFALTRMGELKKIKFFLRVRLWGIDSIKIPHPSLFNDNELGEALDTSVSKGTMKTLQDLFKSLVENIDFKVIDEVVDKLKNFAKAHPYTNIVVKLILVPYEMWKGNREFEGNLKTFVTDICTALKSVANAYDAMTLPDSKEAAQKLFKLIVEASKYVESVSHADDASRGYLEKAANRIKDFIKAQFPKKLDNYRIDLANRRLDFREASLVDLLVKSGAMKDRGDDRSFLRDKLKPSEQLSMDNEWLKDSRTTVMSEVDKWLNGDGKPNVLWISGAPGAGKSAIASRIVRKKILDSKSKFYESHNCATFFIKRGQAALKDPHTIWRSIAMDLVELSLTDSWFRSIRLDILEVMSRKENKLYPKDASLGEQFRQLIHDPLAKLFSDGRSQPRRIVVVIDALDECNRFNEDDRRQWHAFLDTIMEWSSVLPAACKLVVTSRVENPIESRLKEMSLGVRLNSGMEVSNESNADIERLFTEAFEGRVVPQTAIENLTKYAAGLFVWAKTVIGFVCASNFDLRLKTVLDNMSAARGEYNEDKIGRLYGQILFNVASPRLGQCSELDRLSVVLASITPRMLYRPLPQSVLGELLSPGGTLNNNMNNKDINSIVDNLKSIIVTNYEGNEKQLRVCHASVSDFLLDDHRVIQVIEDLVLNKNVDTPGFLAAFSHVRQHAILAKGCLQLINTNAAESFSDTSFSPALKYACTHLTDHLRGAAVEKSSTDYNNDIDFAPLIKTFVDERILLWLDVLSRTGSASDGFNNLRDMVTQLPESSRPDDSVSVALVSIRENVGFETLDIVAKVLDVFAELRPSTKIVIEALFSRYRLIKENREFIADMMTPLMSDLCASLIFMGSSLNRLKLDHVNGRAKSLLEAIIRSSTFIRDLGNLEDDKKLDSDLPTGFRQQIADRLLDFKEGLVVQKLHDINEMNTGDLGDSKSFLRRKLDPVEHLPTDQNCLSGTRASVLRLVQDWLKGGDASNVLWILGVAGAGKTAVASTIYGQLPKSNSGKFFMKKRHPRLRDPSTIWRTIAYQLAEVCQVFRIDILELMYNESYSKDASIEDQFRQLILERLVKQQASTNSMSSWRPVLIIDALDECEVDNQEQWHSFYATIARWNAEMPRTCKLIVTSRPEEEIGVKLMDICHYLVLDPDSPETNDDIRRFFVSEFMQMEIAVPDSDSIIARLTQSAGGVFAWASTVVEFIREKPTEERVERLKEVIRNMVEEDGWTSKLIDIAAVVFVWVATKVSEYVLGKKISGQRKRALDNMFGVQKDRLGKLYAQILFKSALQLSRNLDTLSVVLASVSLPRNPISLKAVRKLLPRDHASPNLDAVVRSLSSLLSGDDSAGIYARHRSFSDFLQDEDRYETAMKSVANTFSANHETFSSALSLNRQHSLFEEGYFCLINACGERAYPLVGELADLRGRRNDQQIKDLALHFTDKIQLETETILIEQLDALVPLTEAWLRFETAFAFAEMKVYKALIELCLPILLNLQANPSLTWVVLIALFDASTLWKGQHKCTDDVKALATKMRESLKSTDAPESPVNAGSKQSQAAMAFLENLAAAFKCVDDVAARFTHSSEIRSSSFNKYRAFLEIYQSSMKYWELELREIRSRNLEGSVDVDWSNRVGIGGFTDVYVGSAKMDNGKVKVAVKHLKSENHADREDTTATAERERRLIEGFVEASRIWSQFNHPNVLKCHGYILQDHSIAVVDEFASKGALHRIIPTPEFGIHEAFAASLGIVKGMCFLHHIGVLHGDLKSPNVLMSDSGEALISMPSCIAFEMTLGDGVLRGSQRWLPYECYHLEGDNNFQRTQKSDVWAFGMTVLELLTGERPYAHIKNDNGVIKAIVDGRPPNKPTINASDPDAKLKRFMWLICLKCWHLNPEERPSMREILEEMLDYPLESAHSMHGNVESPSGIEYAGDSSLLQMPRVRRRLTRTRINHLPD